MGKIVVKNPQLVLIWNSSGVSSARWPATLPQPAGSRAAAPRKLGKDSPHTYVRSVAGQRRQATAAQGPVSNGWGDGMTRRDVGIAAGATAVAIGGLGEHPLGGTKEP